MFYVQADALAGSARDADEDGGVVVSLGNLSPNSSPQMAQA